MRIASLRFCLAVLALSAGLRAEQPYSASQLTGALRDLTAKANHAKHYWWEGTMTIEARVGEAPFQLVSQSKVQVAVAENGRSLLKLRTAGVEEYWLISDGKRTWSYLPGKKEYMVTESGSVSANADDDEHDGSMAESYAWRAVQHVANAAIHAQAIGSTKTMQLKFAGEKVKWPILDIVDKPEEGDAKTIADLVMAPDRPVLGRFVWAEMYREKSEMRVIRVNIAFDGFSLDGPASADLFTFDPPKKAKLVDELAVPGHSGSILLNHSAPDFETKTLTGEKVRLSELRGKVVMLDFWASWCGPCRKELPDVAKLYSEYKDKGLVLYGVDDEGRGVASKYLEKAGLALPTLDDSSERATRLYRVISIPTVFLIDPDGKIVKWINGSRSEEFLRAALKSAGVGN